MSLFNIFKGGALGDVLQTLADQAGATAGKVVKSTPGGIGGLVGAGAVGALLGRMSGSTAQNLALLGAGAVAWNFYQKWAAGKNAEAQAGAEAQPAAQSGGAAAPSAAAPMQLDATSRLVIRAMVYAAKADGNIDAAERGRMAAVIGEMMPGQDVDALIAKFEKETLDPTVLANEVSSLEQGEDVYRLSCMVIDVDHFMERSYLDALGKYLGLTPEAMTRLELEAQEAKAQLQQASVA